jgi:KDO2-lipid IV(A) lauroyltransferase
MVEALKTLSISERNFQKRFKLKNPELLKHLYDDNKSIILYAAHLGNWEWLSIFPTLTPYQVVSFYQPLGNRYFDDLMKTIRQRFGVVCVESKKGFKTLLQYRAKGIQTICFVVGDQSPAGNSTKHWTNFFNTDTAFLIGAETIAEKSDQVLVFPSFSSPRKGYYEVEFIVIEKNESDEKRFALTNAYAKILEENIKKSPQLWLWSHKRWKLRREENK